MSSRIVEELLLFTGSFVWGILMSGAYDVLNLFRHFVPHRNLMISLEDLLYWIAYALLLFRMLYIRNDGVIRGFALIAILLGMITYLQLRKIPLRLIKKLQNKRKGYIMNKNPGKRTGKKKGERSL